MHHYHYFTIEQSANLARQIISKIDTHAEPGRLDSALSFLRSPEYGICERCSGDIPYSRLFEAPLARFCRRCEPSAP